MKLYAKELSEKLLEELKAYLDGMEEDEEGNEIIQRVQKLNGAEIISLKCRLQVDYEPKERITVLDYGMGISVQFIYNEVSHAVKVETKINFTDDIMDLLYSALVDEIHRIDNPDEPDYEDDEK